MIGKYPPDLLRLARPMDDELEHAIEDLADALTRIAGRLSTIIVTARAAAHVHAPALDDLRLYAVTEVAELLRVSRSYVYAEIQAGRLRPVRLGRGDRNKMRISSVDLRAWIEMRRGT